MLVISGGRALVLHAPEAGSPAGHERDVGQHVGQLLLHQLVGGQRTAELLAVSNVLARAVPAVSAAPSAPRRCRSVRCSGQVNGGQARTSGRRFLGQNTLSITISPVIDARRPTLPVDGRRRQALQPFSRARSRGSAPLLVLGPDDEHVGDRAVADPHLHAPLSVAAIDRAARIMLPGRSRGSAQAEAADRFAGRPAGRYFASVASLPNSLIGTITSELLHAHHASSPSRWRSRSTSRAISPSNRQT